MSTGIRLRRGSLLARRPQPKGSEAGDTLVEVLITLVILGITVVALLSGFMTAISASATNQNLTTLDSVLKSFVETATYDLGRAIPTQFVPCAQASNYSGLSETKGVYSASITGSVSYWYQNGWTSNLSNCSSTATPPQQELLTATVTNTANGSTQSINFAVADPEYTPSNPATPTITSANNTTIAAGTSGTFTVTATGSPTPSLTAANLPSWATLQDMGGGIGTLTMNPPQSAASGSPYNTIVFTASSGFNGGTTFNQTFTITVSSPPSFTSVNSDTESPATNFSFPVTASGSPSPTITTTTSPLPTGVTFTSGSGSATLSGDTSTQPGSYTINFVATNTVGTTSQTFTLVISPYTAPSFTSPSSNSGTAIPHVAMTPLQVAATGAPSPALLMIGTVPGLSFSTSTGKLTGTPTTPGTYNLTFTATNAGGTATWPYALTVLPVSTPQIKCVSLSSTTCTAVSKKKNTSFTFYLIATSTTNGFLPNPAVTSGCLSTATPNELSSTVIQVAAKGVNSAKSCSVTETNEDTGSVTVPAASGITLTN